MIPGSFPLFSNRTHLEDLRIRRDNLISALEQNPHDEKLQKELDKVKALIEEAFFKSVQNNTWQ